MQFQKTPSMSVCCYTYAGGNWWQSYAAPMSTVYSSLKKKKETRRKTTFSLLSPPVHRSIPHGFTYTGCLPFSLAEPFHPIPPAQRVPVCVSPSLPTCAHVVCSSSTCHSLISFPSACTVYVRLGHRLATFIDPWRCTARIARCPPTGLVPRYRPDEFMSEVTTVFPCSIPPPEQGSILVGS